MVTKKELVDFMYITLKNKNIKITKKQLNKYDKEYLERVINRKKKLRELFEDYLHKQSYDNENNNKIDICVEENSYANVLIKLIKMIKKDPSLRLDLKTFFDHLPLGTIDSKVLEYCANSLNTKETVKHSLIVLEYKSRQDYEMILKDAGGRERY